jgi:membrane-associated protein
LIGPDLGRLGLLMLVAGIGALAGDCLGYEIGRSAGPRAVARLQRGQRGRQRVEWARARLHRYAAWLIIGGRYLPSGRVATTLASGSLHLSRRRYVLLDVVAAAIWAVYTAAIGHLGGTWFADDPARGLLLAFGITLAMLLVVAIVRRLRGARGRARVSEMDGQHALSARDCLTVHDGADSGHRGEHRCDDAEHDGGGGQPQGGGEQARRHRRAARR